MSDEIRSVGMIGLGAMGSRFARRLLDAGYEVHGYNRTDGRAGELDGAGLIRHVTPREVAAASDVVLIMLWDSPAVAGAVEGSDGLLAGLRSGSVIIDLSTIEPAESQRLASKVMAHASSYLDVPVSGSLDRASAGTLLAMVGGAPEAVVAVRPVIDVLADRVVLAGGNGAGLALKLAINLQVAIQLIGWGESLGITARAGIDTASAAAIMLDSVISSPMLRYRIPFTFEAPDEVWANCEQLLKDVRYAIASGAKGPTALMAESLLGRIVADGRGEREAAELAVEARHAGKVRA
jgi:3-hydroxyisobutyrate dehydrogenase-like beta-hydroxyacid dehydrogenase